MKHTAELLMPAGSLEKLKVAILYGADAVYMGTPDLSLRTRSNFSLDEVLEGVAFAHAHGKRAYLTLNLFSHNRDIEKLPEYVQTIRKVGPDKSSSRTPASSITSSKPRLSWRFISRHRPMCVRGFRWNSGKNSAQN